MKYVPPQPHTMEPLDEGLPFQCRSITEVMAFAACNDGEGYIEYDGVAISVAPDSGTTGIPASAKLMEFLNENRRHQTGWTAHPIAAALVDNHFSSINGVDSQGGAGGAKSVEVSRLLADQGPVEAVIDEWDVFFSERQHANLEVLQTVLLDVELHLGHRIAASEVDHLTRANLPAREQMGLKNANRSIYSRAGINREGAGWKSPGPKHRGRHPRPDWVR